MIVSGMLSYTASGHIRVTTHVPDAVSNGTPTYQRMLSYTLGVPFSYNDEIGYLNDSVCVQLTAPRMGDATFSFTPVSDAPIAYWYCGLPFSEDGRLAIHFDDVPPPLNTHAFSLGFDQGAFS